LAVAKSVFDAEHGDLNGTDVFKRLRVSLLLGLLVGLQREDVATKMPGLWTFPMITVLGIVLAFVPRTVELHDVLVATGSPGARGAGRRWKDWGAPAGQDEIRVDDGSGHAAHVLRRRDSFACILLRNSGGIGQFYEEFKAVEDEEVLRLLKKVAPAAP